MKIRMWTMIGALAMVASLGILVGTGCEGAGGDTRSLTVTPSFVDLSASGTSSSSNATQTFTVSEDSLVDLSLPLIWSVANPQLGIISFSGGRSASYVRVSGARGDNAIIVEDQFGSRGTATVRH